MGVRLTKPWRALDDLASVHGHLGVYELADAGSQIIYIGFAGGRSLFGLRGELLAAPERFPEAASYRVEVNTSYRTRHRELLMAYVADHGVLPARNDADPTLGRLSPG